MTLDQEAITKIAADAAVAAVAAALAAAGASALAAPAEEPATVSTNDPGPPTAEEIAEFEAAELQHEKAMAAVEDLAKDLLPLIIAARHRVVFDWLAEQRGVTAAGLITQIIRNEISREMSSYRAAFGGGGSSSKNLEELSARLPKA